MVIYIYIDGMSCKMNLLELLHLYKLGRHYNLCEDDREDEML